MNNPIPSFSFFGMVLCTYAIHLPGEENETERRIGKEVKGDEEKPVPDHDDACSTVSDDRMRNNR
jgi:hypothetical protein